MAETTIQFNSIFVHWGLQCAPQTEGVHTQRHMWESSVLQHRRGASWEECGKDGGFRVDTEISPSKSVYPGRPTPVQSVAGAEGEPGEAERHRDSYLGDPLGGPALTPAPGI